MKKLIFISLLAISVCKGADDKPTLWEWLTLSTSAFLTPLERDPSYGSWDQALQAKPNWQQREILDLGFNRIAAIPANFNPLQLRVLDLSHNQLIALPANFNPPQLRRLYLDHNRLGTLPTNFNPPQLQELYLENNQLIALPTNFNPPQLRRLYLDRNRLGALPANFNPPQLEYLYLRGNQFDHIYPEILDKFPNLKRLDLSNNPIYEGGTDGVNALRAYAVEHYPNLEIIADNILPGDPPGIDIKGE